MTNYSRRIDRLVTAQRWVLTLGLMVWVAALIGSVVNRNWPAAFADVGAFFATLAALNANRALQNARSIILLLHTTKGPTRL